MPTLADVYNHCDTYLDTQVDRALIDQWAAGGRRQIVDYTVWANQYIEQDLAVYSDGLDIEDLSDITDVDDPNRNKISMVGISGVVGANGALDFTPWRRGKSYWARRTGSTPLVWTTVGGAKGVKFYVWPAPDRPDSGTTPAPVMVSAYGRRDTKVWLAFPKTVPFVGDPTTEQWPTVDALFDPLLNWVLAEALEQLGQEGAEDERDKFWLKLEQYRSATIPTNEASFQLGGSGPRVDTYPGVSRIIVPAPPDDR